MLPASFSGLVRVPELSFGAREAVDEDTAPLHFALKEGCIGEEAVLLDFTLKAGCIGEDSTLIDSGVPVSERTYCSISSSFLVKAALRLEI